MNITKIELRKIKNSGGGETVEAAVYANNIVGVASAAAGTSTGKHEAVFAPKPVDFLIRNAKEKLIPKLIGLDAIGQQMVDDVLHETDRTKNFSKIGGAVSTAVSLAAGKAGAALLGIPFFKYINKHGKYKIPMQLGVCIGGGKHSRIGKPEIQEFLAAPAAGSIKKCAIINKEIRRRIGGALRKKVAAFEDVLDMEGGWVAPITNEQALETLGEVAEEVGSENDAEIKLGIDCAASSIFRSRKYCYENMKRNTGEQLGYISRLVKSFGIKYVEDPFSEEDFESFAKLQKKEKTMVCGDDLLTTNPERLKKAIKAKSCNAIIIKPNQIGTLSETCEVIRLAQKKGIEPIVSHRSCETLDSSISHIAVAFSAPFVKVGIIGAEREAKIKELIKIEEYLRR